MSKTHYIIDSRKKARIEKGISRTTVIIEDVVSIEENHETLLNYGELINDNERNRKKHVMTTLHTFYILLRRV